MDTLIRRIYNDELNRLGDKCRALEAENAKLRKACTALYKAVSRLTRGEWANGYPVWQELNNARTLAIDVLGKGATNEQA